MYFWQLGWLSRSMADMAELRKRTVPFLDSASKTPNWAAARIVRKSLSESAPAQCQCALQLVSSVHMRVGLFSHGNSMRQAPLADLQPLRSPPQSAGRP